MEPIRLPHSTIPISEKRWWFPPVSSICHNQNVQVLPDDDPKEAYAAEYDAQHQPGDEFPPHHPPPVRNRQFPSAMAWMIRVEACDPLLPPLLMIRGMKRASTVAVSISF